MQAFFQEDATGMVAVTPDVGAGRRWRISINGKGNSGFPHGGVHTLLGAIPAALHPAPSRVLGREPIAEAALNRDLFPRDEFGVR